MTDDREFSGESRANGRGDESDASGTDALLDELLSATGDTENTTVFPIGFRGYDREAVDDAIRQLAEHVRKATDDTHDAKRRAEAMFAQQRAEHDTELEESARRYAEEVASLQEQLRAASARAADAEAQVHALSDDFATRDDDDPQRGREHFDAILRVAEEQAAVLVQNAVAQAERLLASAHDEAAAIREEAVADQNRLRAEAQHDADQVRLRIETESTAHVARLEREGAHAAEKVAQAQREAVAIRTEAEKGAAALRSLVSRETGDLRAKAERDVREMTARVLEFEESLTRRQDEAQQEFLVLHNQAVAHAERITGDASDQVAAALEHARRISARADDYERLARAQAQQTEASAHVRAREILDGSRDRAQRIADKITEHAASVLRDAEDRSRDLRWQQQQVGSFMAEMNELLRTATRDGSSGVDADEDAPAGGAEETEVTAVRAETREQADPPTRTDGDG